MGFYLHSVSLGTEPYLLSPEQLEICLPGAGCALWRLQDFYHSEGRMRGRAHMWTSMFLCVFVATVPVPSLHPKQEYFSLFMYSGSSFNWLKTVSSLKTTDRTQISVHHFGPRWCGHSAHFLQDPTSSIQLV